MPLDLPVPGADANTWGTKLNNALNGTGPGTLSATYVPKWAANTAYAAGDRVVNPSGDIVLAKTAHTSGTTYSATNWNLPATYAQLKSGKVQTTQLPTRQVQTFARVNPAAAKPWLTKAVNRKTARATVVCIGDSITEGQGATAMSKRYVEVLRTELRARYTTTAAGGQGWLSCDYDATGFAEPSVIAGSTVRNNDYGVGRKTRGLNAGATITFSFTGTMFDLYYVRGNGILGVQIDGGAVTNVDTAGTFGDGFKWTSPALTAGAHTVVVSYVSGATPYISGMHVYNGDNTQGIHIIESGHHGWDSTQWNTSTGATNWRAAIAAAAPDLVTIFLGVNDCIGGDDPALTVTNLQNIMSILRTATSNTSLPFVLVAPFQPSSGFSVTPYVQAVRDAAAIDGNAAVLDLSLLMSGSNDNSAGLLTADLVHPSDAGHDFIGKALADYLAA